MVLPLRRAPRQLHSRRTLLRQLRREARAEHLLVHLLQAHHVGVEAQQLSQH
jgi:hypothetical protein